jgi:glycosyltransferase involved in cell wall biosynthesis
MDGMRVAIDVRKIDDFGVGTYVRNLLRWLAKLDQENDYILICRRADCERLEALGPNFRPLPSRSQNYSIAEQLTVPLNLLRTGVDLFHAPHYVVPALTPCRVIVTIHDCIHLMFPEYLPGRLAHLYARIAFSVATRRSTKVLTVSEASKRDILKYCAIRPDKVDVIYNAIDDRFNETPAPDQIANVRERYQLHDRFLLYSGNVKPHKNLERVIDAFARLRQRGFDEVKLLISGSEISRYATLRRAVHRYNLHKHVRFLGFLSADTLAALYHLADAFVFPSLYEGFGLPPLEAMASGTPVLTSSLSSLPEVVGEAALLVNPHDAESIADGMQQILSDTALRERLTHLGRIRASEFSWESSVRRVLAAYREVSAS